MMTQEKCREQWNELKKEMEKQITKIDEVTPWTEHEPLWWYDMMEVLRLLRK